jgi:DNA-binding transcriptional LysR family regulator
MLNVTLKQLRALVAVSRNGSISKAAASLHLSQPALTMQLRHLESAIDAQLFDRTTRRLEPTQAGKILLPVATRVLSEIAEGLEQIDLVVRHRAGSVGIVAGASVIQLAIVPAIAKISTVYPDISVRVTESVGEEIGKLVTMGQADFGIGNFSVDGETVESHFLLKDEVGVLCSRHHELARKKHLFWRDVCKHPYAVSRGQGSAIRTLAARNAAWPIPVRPQFETSNMTSMFSLVEQCACIALLPTIAALRAPRRSMVFRTIKEPALYRELYLVMPRHRRLSPTSKQVALTVLSQLQSVISRPRVKSAIVESGIDRMRHILEMNGEPFPAPN